VSKATITESLLTDIADAIRAKLHVGTNYRPGDMPGAIAQIHDMPALQSLTVTSNGNYTPSSGYYGFDSVSVNVNVPPSAYSRTEMTSIVGVYVIRDGGRGWCVYPTTAEAENAETFYANIPSTHQNGGFILLSTVRPSGATYEFTRNRVAFTDGTEDPANLPDGSASGRTTGPAFFLNALSNDKDRQFTFLKVPTGMTRVYWTNTQASYRVNGQKSYMICLTDEILQAALCFDWKYYININDKLVTIDTSLA